MTDRRFLGGVARTLFGDRVGLAFYLAALVAFTVLWIATWRINDSIVLVNGLHALGQGHLAITQLAYPPPSTPVGDTYIPGLVRVDGKAYARNYGVIVPSLIPLIVLEGLARVADLRLAFAGAWSLTVLALAIVIGRITNRRSDAVRVGAPVALGLFVLNLAVATPLDESALALYALQLTHLLVGSLAVVFVYRLAMAVHGRREGLFAGVLVLGATPLGLWATLPKRHAVTGAVVVVLAFCLVRAKQRADSRGDAATESPRARRPWHDPVVRLRLAGYALVGLYTWVHAAEGLVLFLLYLVLDLIAHPSWDARVAGTLAGGFAASLIPTAVTNWLVTGSPIRPPRVALTGRGLGATSGTDGGSQSGPSDGGQTVLDAIGGAVEPVIFPLDVLVSMLQEGFATVFANPGRLWTVFVRTGYAAEVVDGGIQQAIGLAVLEAAPVLLATFVVVPAAARWLRRAPITRFAGNRVASLRSTAPRSMAETNWRRLPAVPVVAARRHVTARHVLDAFLVGMALLFALVYLPRLPTQAQLTQRYLFPLYLVGILGLVRFEPIRAVANRHLSTFGWTYAGGVLIGGQLLFVWLAGQSLGLGEAVQFHALLHLGLAVPLGLWALVGSTDDRWARLGAVLFGLTAAATTSFYLFQALAYHASTRVGSSQILPIVRWLGEVAPLL